MAKDARLRYVNDAMPGIRRRGRRRFHYVAGSGRRIRDAKVLARIRALAIPPAWSDVWICSDPQGHVQATGRDARGRKQYRYHAAWKAQQGRDKHERIVAFGAALPRLRRALRKSLAIAGLPKDKVVAMVVAVMGATLVRIGNEEYAASNRSYGLTTLRNRHVQAARNGGLRFRFRGKSGKPQDVLLNDARLARMVRRCQHLPGQVLFQYVDEQGGVQPIDSSDVNDWLRASMGQEFSAKDFRTWGATMIAFRALASTEVPVGKNGHPAPERVLAEIENTIVEQVAAVLGNTRTVCRSSYIDPSLLPAWRAGRLGQHARGAKGERHWEAAALRFLRAQRRDA
jgi:DNA topoisomerase IB